MVSIDSPVLPRVYLVLLVAFLIGIALQMRWLRKAQVTEPHNR